MAAAFLTSLVEAVEALTIVLAVATVRGWRPAGLGALAGLMALVIIVVSLGPLLDRVPLRFLQLLIGILLLLFGVRWLRKAIRRSAGVIPLHDEAMTFATEPAELWEQARRNEVRLNWLAALTSFKAVLLEGLEVVFIVIALIPAGAGAVAACLVVAGVGLTVHRPLARDSGKHAQIRRRHHAVGIRRLLDGRRSRSGLARGGSGDPRICGAVPGCQRRGGRPRAQPKGRGVAMITLTSLLRALDSRFGHIRRWRSN
jgi:uncharacterized membrane protein